MAAWLGLCTGTVLRNGLKRANRYSVELSQRCYNSVMKLYLSSVEIPTPDVLAALLGKPLNETTVALLPNAQDYYSERARLFKINKRVAAMTAAGLQVTVIDLRDYSDAAALQSTLAKYDLIWAMGGNTFCLRYEMKRSGFDAAIRPLLSKNIVYGGDSAGALVVSPSIAGIESADIPEYAEKIIHKGLGLVPYVILPHVDNADLADVLLVVRKLHEGKNEIIELKDSQAVIFQDEMYRLVE